MGFMWAFCLYFIINPVQFKAKGPTNSVYRFQKSVVQEQVFVVFNDADYEDDTIFAILVK